MLLSPLPLPAGVRSAVPAPHWRALRSMCSALGWPLCRLTTPALGQPTPTLQRSDSRPCPLSLNPFLCPAPPHQPHCISQVGMESLLTRLPLLRASTHSRRIARRHDGWQHRRTAHVFGRGLITAASSFASINLHTSSHHRTYHLPAFGCSGAQSHGAWPPAVGTLWYSTGPDCAASALLWSSAALAICCPGALSLWSYLSPISILLFF